MTLPWAHGRLRCFPSQVTTAFSFRKEACRILFHKAFTQWVPRMSLSLASFELHTNHLNLLSLILIFWNWDNNTHLIGLNDFLRPSLEWSVQRMNEGFEQMGLIITERQGKCCSQYLWGICLFSPLSYFNQFILIYLHRNFFPFLILRAIKNKRHTCKLNLYLVNYIILQHKIWQDSCTFLLPFFLTSDQSYPPYRQPDWLMPNKHMHVHLVCIRT